MVGSCHPGLFETNILSSWLKCCITQHTLCASSLSLPNIPNRVIDVTSLYELFLLESKGRKADYVALSYCWGTPRRPEMMLFGPGSKGKKGEPDPEPNLEAHKSRIVFSDMPKTLQDAVIITRGLGFKYLWIDSLCIVQGDDMEWRKENLTLGDVYSRAILVIAASCADSMDAGFLNHPRTGNQGPTGAEENMAQNCEPACLRPLTLKDEPLNRRAWALSEAALSNRIVHFTSNGMIWECNELRRHERGQFQLVDQNDADSFRMLRETDTAQECSITDLYSKWKTFVEHFTQRTINSTPKERDKDHRRMLAIARVAKRFSEVCWQLFHREESYVAGLWEGDLRMSMVWSVEKGLLEEASVEWRRPVTHMAPTWSWASIEGTVSFERFVSFESSIIHVKVAMEPCCAVTPSEHPTSWGEPRRGKLVLQGKVLHNLSIASHLPIGSDPVTRHHVMVYLPGSSIACKFVSDIPDIENGQGQKFSCLDLGRGSQTGGTDSKEQPARSVLLIRRVMGQGRTFERVGISSHCGGANLDALVERMETDTVTIV